MPQAGASKSSLAVLSGVISGNLVCNLGLGHSRQILAWRLAWRVKRCGDLMVGVRVCVAPPAAQERDEVVEEAGQAERVESNVREVDRGEGVLRHEPLGGAIGDLDWRARARVGEGEGEGEGDRWSSAPSTARSRPRRPP